MAFQSILEHEKKYAQWVINEPWDPHTSAAFQELQEWLIANWVAALVKADNGVEDVVVDMAAEVLQAREASSDADASSGAEASGGVEHVVIDMSAEVLQKLEVIAARLEDSSRTVVHNHQMLVSLLDQAVERLSAKMDGISEKCAQIEVEVAQSNTFKLHAAVRSEQLETWEIAGRSENDPS